MSIAEKLTRIAENEQKVYDAGKSIGYMEGEAIAYEKPFLDTSKITSFTMFCYGHNIPQAQLKNISFSSAASTYQMFYVNPQNVPRYTVIPKLETSKAKYFGYMFDGSSTIETIEGIDFSSAIQFAYMFRGCTSLKNLTVNGTIKASKLDTSPCTLLSKASIESIINALSSATSALDVTFSQTAVDTAFETSKGAADGSTSEEWAALIATKQNWTISLV